MNKTIELEHTEICASPKSATVRIGKWRTKFGIGVGAALLLVLATSIQFAVCNGNTLSQIAAGLDPTSATVNAQLGDQAAYKGDFQGAVMQYRRSLAKKYSAIVQKKLALMLVGCEKHDPRCEVR